MIQVENTHEGYYIEIGDKKYYMHVPLSRTDIVVTDYKTSEVVDLPASELLVIF